jgi:hypothetical protein
MGFVAEALLGAAAVLWVCAWVWAAVRVSRQGRWVALVAGLVTLGLFWFFDPRTWDGISVGRASSMIGTFVVLALVAGALAARPVAVFGVDRGALERSVRAAGAPDPCGQVHGGRWRCEISTADQSGAVAYRVDVAWTGCWTATLIGPPRSDAPGEKRGCIRAFNYLVR